MKRVNSIEAIFRNTQRIHGKSESLDWIKIASIKVERYLNTFVVQKPTDKEIELRAIELLESGMALQNESPISYTHKQVCLHDAQGFRAGAKWAREK